MKTTIFCLALLNPSMFLFAAAPPQQVEVKASFIDPAKNLLSAPVVTTMAGITAQIRSTQDNALRNGGSLPSGGILNIKTEIIDGRISYSGLLTMRQKTASEEKAEHSQMVFSTTEILFSGVTDSGQQTQFGLPDGSSVELTMTIVNPDGTPAKKS